MVYNNNNKVMISDEAILSLSYLVSKLVAGKCQDNQSIPKEVNEFIQLDIVPDSRASQRGNILNEDHFAAILLQ